MDSRGSSVITLLSDAVLRLRPGLSPIVLASATAAALAGWFAVQGPQPATDLLIARGLVQPVDHTAVLVVGMDGAESNQDWVEAAERAQRAGATRVAAINPPGSIEGAVVLERGDVQALGLGIDRDGIARRFEAGPETLPGQLVPERGAGEWVYPGEAAALPTVGLHNLDYLDAAAFEGRTVVLGELTPWAVPVVETASGSIPLTEALARTAAVDGRRPVQPWMGALTGAALGGLGGFLLLVTVARRRWPALLGSALALPLVVGLLGGLLPIEVPLLVAGLGVLTAHVLRWALHSAGFKELVDRAIWHLHSQPRTVDLQRDWQELCAASVDLGVSERVWAIEEREDGFRVVAAAGASGLVEVGDGTDLPSPFANPLSIPLRSRCGRFGALLIDPTDVDVDLRALYALAAHQARRKRVAAPVLETREGYVAVGLGIVNAAFDALMNDATSMGATARVGAARRAIFDPLGRLVNLDNALEEILFPEGRPERIRLSAVWQTLGGTRAQVLGVMNGEQQQRMPHESGALLVLTAAHRHGRLQGFVVELIRAPGAESAAGVLGPRLAVDNGRSVKGA
jgi:hypothetical protein